MELRYRNRLDERNIGLCRPCFLMTVPQAALVLDVIVPSELPPCATGISGPGLLDSGAGKKKAVALAARSCAI